MIWGIFARIMTGFAIAGAIYSYVLFIGDGDFNHFFFIFFDLAGAGACWQLAEMFLRRFDTTTRDEQ